MESASNSSVWVLGLGYWIPLIVLGIFGNFIDTDWALPASVIAFWVIMLFVWCVSFTLSGLQFGKWYKKIFLWGASDLAINMSNLSHEPDEFPFWVAPFEFWFSFSMKYFFSFAIWWLFNLQLRFDLPLKDGETFYNGYHWFWQLMGFIYPIIGLLIFGICAFFCTTSEEIEE